MLLKPGAGAGKLPTKPEVSFGISNVFKDGDLVDLAEVSMAVTKLAHISNPMTCRNPNIESPVFELRECYSPCGNLPGDLELGHGATLPWSHNLESTPKDLATELAELLLVGFIVSTTVYMAEPTSETSEQELLNTIQHA